MNELDSKSIERMGVSHCEKVLAKQGIIFREQPTSDYGIDAQIELKDSQSGSPSGKLVAVQIKSGPSYFSEVSDNNIIYRGDMQHYEYWMNHSLPVIIVLYNSDTDECIWEHINSSTAHMTGNGWKIAVPRNHPLEDCKSQLEKVAENQTEYEKKMNMLLLAKPWMQAITRGDTVILEAEEWVNKSSGRGAITLKILHEDVERTVINWPYVFFGLRNYADVFRDLFPWADFDADEELFGGDLEYEFISETCPYDSETGEFLFTDSKEFLEDYEKYLRELPKIRPYEIVAGEVARYRLILSLNKLGNAFIEVDKFLENNSAYYFSKKDLLDH